MYILFTIGSAKIGGAENFIWRLSKVIKSIFNDIKIDLIVLYQKGKLERYYEQSFDRVYYVEDGKTNLSKLLNLNKYTMIHAFDSFDFILNCAKVHNVTIFIHTVFPDITESVYAPSIAWLNEAPVYYRGFITEIDKNRCFLTTPTKRPSFVSVIKNGIDLTFWRSTSNILDRFYDICWVGRPDVHKGIEILKSIVDKCYAYKFCIVFNEPMEPYYTMFKNLRRKNLKFLCSTDHSTLRDIYNASKIYLHTSFTEGQPATLLEAMACGCVPVVGGVGGIVECINVNGSVYGKVVPKRFGTTDSIYIQYISDLLNSNTLLETLNKNAINYVNNNHNIVKTAEQYYDSYKLLLV